MTGLRPAAVRKGSAFPAHLARFLFLRAAGRLCLPGARRRFRGGLPRRKGGAFPHSKRRSRRSPFNGLTAIWTRLTRCHPLRGLAEKIRDRNLGKPYPYDPLIARSRFGMILACRSRESTSHLGAVKLDLVKARFFCSAFLGIKAFLDCPMVSGNIWFLEISGWSLVDGAIAIYSSGAAFPGVPGFSVGWALFQIAMILTGNVAGLVTGEWREMPARISRVSMPGVVVLFLAVILIAAATIRVEEIVVCFRPRGSGQIPFSPDK